MRARVCVCEMPSAIQSTRDCESCPPALPFSDSNTSRRHANPPPLSLCSVQLEGKPIAVYVTRTLMVCVGVVPVMPPKRGIFLCRGRVEVATGVSPWNRPVQS